MGNEVIEAEIIETSDLVNKELKNAGYQMRLKLAQFFEAKKSLYQGLIIYLKK